MTPASAPATDPADDGIDNLMVMLRESPGADKQDEALEPMDDLEVLLPDGTTGVLTPAWFGYLGDMHVRLVFDSAKSVRSARIEDLERLQLTPEAAIARAMRNVARVYGEPASVPWNVLMQVRGRSLDYDSSYFLDREFWRALLERHPDGLVVAVPRQEFLLWAPAVDTEVVDAMRRNVARMHEEAEDLRISSALYLFKDDRWTVFQRAQPVDDAD